MYHNILIVDDEAHVTEALKMLLEAQTDIECEVFTASGSAEALGIARRERIDLMISDVYMPDMSGLDLIGEMRKLWPVCQTILLTGYADFENAYQALQLKVAGFLLKTESDEQILNKIREVLQKIDSLLLQTSLLEKNSRPPVKELDLLLEGDDGSRSRYLTALSISPEKPFLMCLCNARENQAPAIDILIRHYMGSRVSVICSLSGTETDFILWLFQEPSGDMTPMLISNMLETVNNSYYMTTQQSFSCVIAPANLSSFRQIFSELKSAITESPERKGSIAVLNPLQHNSTEYAVQFVRRYIKEHISEDVTVSALADVTGYNADYLARIFRSHSGQTIGQYIINERMRLIRSLMVDDEKTLEEIARETGFSSRAYFNRFIRRITGMSPRTLRISIQNGQKS